MMPVGIHTQVAPPTQVSSVPAMAPGTGVVHAPATMVAPSVQSGAVIPDRQRGSGYVPQQAAAALPSPVNAPLTILMPSSLSTSSASLGASTMFATLLLSQNDTGAAPLLAVYEEMVAVSQVKYKPSMAAEPQPAPNNLFAKMLQEETSHSTLREIIQQGARENVTHVSQQVAASAPRAMVQHPSHNGGQPISRRYQL